MEITTTIQEGPEEMEESDVLLRHKPISSSQSHRRGTLVIAMVTTSVFAFAVGALMFKNPKPASTEAIPVNTVPVELEGLRHSKESPSLSCADGGYSKRTLKLAYELPFAALFKDNKGERKYEASSVVVVDDYAYAVCDSSWAISKFSASLDPFGSTNVQLGNVHREPDDSGYEALVHEDGTFYVIRESIKHGDKTYHAVIEELELGDEDYEVKSQCLAEFEFEGDAKGFEGAIALYDTNNEMVLLGLCEGNHCSEKRKNDTGNGRLVAMKKDHDDCIWKTLRIIDLPASANFRDYSAITITDSGKVGVSSQEEGQFWVGQMLGQNKDGLWDIDKIEFKHKADLYDFPKDNQCERIYCNVEGVHWINDDMIMAVSDKMKGKGKQDFRCFDKDQSVHVFVLPE